MAGTSHVSGRVHASRVGPPAALRRVSPLAAALLLGAVAASSTTLLALTSDHVEHPLATGLYKSYLAVAPILVGLLWTRRRPQSRFGQLLVALGICGWILGLQSANAPVVHSLAVMGDFPFIALNFYICLAFPYGRLRSTIDRVLIGVFVIALAQFAVPWLLLGAQLQGGGPLSRCAPGCPPNHFQLASAPDLLTALGHVEVAVGLAVTAGIFVRFLWRLRTATRPQRRALTAVATSSLLLLPAFFAFHLAGELAPDDTALLDTLGWILVAARVLFPLGFLAALLQADLFAVGAQRRLMGELAAGPTPAAWEAAVARALHDPGLRIGFWDASTRSYHGTDGALLAPEEAGSASFRVRREGHRVAVIVADASLREDPELVWAATSATLVAVERGDLLGELRASRARLVAAADAERGRLQRDLHDSAQQRLIALRVKLGLAALVAESPDGREQLEQFGGDVDAALQELRDLAHGMYPQLLAEYGVGEALRAALAGSSARIRLVEHRFGRHAAPIENAIYFSCLEAAQNATKHAGHGAELVIELGRTTSEAWFVVSDDGAGFDPSVIGAGAGLVNIADRLAAVGGALAINSAPARGCRVNGRVPLAGSPTQGEASSPTGARFSGDGERSRPALSDSHQGPAQRGRP